MGDPDYETGELLSDQTKDLHEALVSMIEELEAADWHAGRAEACTSEALRKELVAQQDEQIDRAMMKLEWIRRNSAAFDTSARRFLFTDKTNIEADPATNRAQLEALPARGPTSVGAQPVAGSLGIGSLRDPWTF